VEFEDLPGASMPQLPLVTAIIDYVSVIVRDGGRLRFEVRARLAVHLLREPLLHPLPLTATSGTSRGPLITPGASTCISMLVAKSQLSSLCHGLMLLWDLGTGAPWASAAASSMLDGDVSRYDIL
jgi:hypothetical protein